MATTGGAAASALTQLSRVIREYSLFQAILQVINCLREAHPLLDEDALYDLLEFQANPGLGFPGHDIDRVQFFIEHDQLRARLRLNVLSLCGAGSPLPAFYGEQAYADGPAGTATREFLDVFHHRLQRLMLPVWRKYRYRARFEAGAHDDFSEQMFALIGLKGRQIRGVAQVDCKRLLPYLGLLSLRMHSATLIETVLRHYFKHNRLFVEQWVLRTVVIADSQRNQLGVANSMLGHDQVLGNQVFDRSGKFRIHLEGLGWDQFHGFLPSGKDYPLLCSLVRLTVRDPLLYDLRLVIAKQEIRPLHIGEHNACRLGWTSWLAHECADGVVTVPSNVIGG